MNIHRSRFVAMAFVILSAISGARAEAQIAFDAQVELLPGGDITSPGGESRWRLTMRNTGIEPIIAPVSGAEFIELGSGKTFHLYGVPETAPCTIHATDFWSPQTQQVEIVATVFFADRPLAPGASTSCIVGVTIDPEAPPVFVLDFGFQGSGSVTLYEHVPITFVLSTFRKPTPIPALSYWGWVIIIAGFALMARARH